MKFQAKSLTVAVLALAGAVVAASIDVPQAQAHGGGTVGGGLAGQQQPLCLHARSAEPWAAALARHHTAQCDLACTSLAMHCSIQAPCFH